MKEDHKRSEPTEQHNEDKQTNKQRNKPTDQKSATMTTKARNSWKRKLDMDNKNRENLKPNTKPNIH